MRMLFKQRFFSWLDSYDIFDETGATVYTVEGKLAWGHCLHILDPAGQLIGSVREEIFTLLPRFRIYLGETCVGEIQKEFTLFRPAFRLEYNGWRVEGDFFAWEYEITDAAGRQVAHLSKELFRMTDTYVMEFEDPANALQVLMIALAIDAAKCSAGN